MTCHIREQFTLAKSVWALIEQTLDEDFKLDPTCL